MARVDQYRHGPAGSAMLSVFGSNARLCDGLTRREVLRIGGVSAFGLALPQLIGGSASAAPSVASVVRSGGRAKNCIVLFLIGGPPQHSTWDPKPDAPPEIRGEFGPISTSVSGLSISELLPETARIAKHLCVLRAVHSGDNAHSSSGYYMLTGRPHTPTKGRLGPESNRRGEFGDPQAASSIARIAVSGWLMGSTPTRLTIEVIVPSASASTQAARCSSPR